MVELVLMPKFILKTWFQAQEDPKWSCILLLYISYLYIYKTYFFEKGTMVLDSPLRSIK